MKNIYFEIFCILPKVGQNLAYFGQVVAVHV